MTDQPVGDACSNRISMKCKIASQDSGRTSAHRRLDWRMTVGIYSALRKQKDGRSWEYHVGFTLDDLVVHLEALFLPGMSWENIGDWHLDHKIPRSAFTYSSPDDSTFKVCWALSNLQPLWAVDNMSKGARLDWIGPHSNRQ